MEDLERYGDYNDPEEEGVPKQKHLGFKLVKWLFLFVVFAVVAVLGYRLYLFDYYPSELRSFVVTERFDALRQQTGAAPAIKTQKLRFPYDDNDLNELNSNDLGTFFANHLYVCEATGELQITVRANTADLEAIAAKYDSDADADATLSLLTFRLVDNRGRVYDSVCLRKAGSHAMYRYAKLCFDGIEFTDPADGLGTPEWMRLEILFDGQSEPYSYLLIYENNEDFATFTEYRLTGKEPSHLDP